MLTVKCCTEWWPCRKLYAYTKRLGSVRCDGRISISRRRDARRGAALFNSIIFAPEKQRTEHLYWPYRVPPPLIVDSEIPLRRAEKSRETRKTRLHCALFLFPLRHCVGCFFFYARLFRSLASCMRAGEFIADVKLAKRDQTSKRRA